MTDEQKGIILNMVEAYLFHNVPVYTETDRQRCFVALESLVASVPDDCGVEDYLKRVPYTVQCDDEAPKTIYATCLAELAHKVRGKYDTVKVWSPAGLMLINTKFGDTYKVAKNNS